MHRHFVLSLFLTRTYSQSLYISLKSLLTIIMANPETIVCVEQGQLLGKISKNIHGNFFFSFQGIPYAKPPLREFRFKAPQPPEPWSGVRDARKEGSECYSKHILSFNLVGSEDCLFLNVYTPQLPSSASATLKPVMVWVHGGEFSKGSSNADIYGPQYLMTEDIVLITVNYRLGILGFLHFDDPSLEIPGNAGFKDVVMALKWVQKNISKFSGDPNNVTVFGNSAGGMIAHYLVLSPLAKGLFHKTIVQSGCTLNSPAQGCDDIISHLASALGLKSNDENMIYHLLKDLPIEDLFELSEKVITTCFTSRHAGGRLAFSAVIEPLSAEAFISEKPITILKSGNYNQVPIIFGYTTHEGMTIEVKLKSLKSRILRDFEQLVPYALNVKRGSEASERIADKIKQFYCGEPESEHKLDNFYKLYTDNYFLRDIMLAAQLHAATSSFPIYLYRMSIDTTLNIFKKISRITAPGVCHGDDIGYLFKTTISPPLKPGSLEELSVKRFVNYWTNFAKYGNPNFQGEPRNPQWKPVEKDAINFIDIGEVITEGVNPEAERMKFWREIFRANPLYSL